MPALGDDIRRFATFMMIAHATLGDLRFRQLLSRRNQIKVINRWVSELKAQPAPAYLLDDMKRCYRDIVLPDIEAPPTGATLAGASAPPVPMSMPVDGLLLPGGTALPMG